MASPDRDPFSPRAFAALSLSAASSAAITSFFVSPFEVAKVRLQTHNLTQPTNHALESTRRGIWSTLRSIAHQEGVVSLWRGMRPTLLMVLPSSALYFSLYEKTKYILERNHHKVISEYSPLLAGGLSRTLIVTATLPLELLRTNMQFNKDKAAISSFEILHRVVRKCGVSSLWTGLGATIVRDAPFSAIYWFGYERLKVYYRSVLPAQNDSPVYVTHFLAAASSGAIAAIITNPADVVKTRIQVTVGNCGTLAKSSTTIAVIKDVALNQGYHGFFMGLNARLTRIPISCAVMMSTYEWAKNFFFSQFGA